MHCGSTLIKFISSIGLYESIRINSKFKEVNSFKINRNKLKDERLKKAIDYYMPVAMLKYQF